MKKDEGWYILGGDGKYRYGVIKGETVRQRKFWHPRYVKSLLFGGMRFVLKSKWYGYKEAIQDSSQRKPYIILICESDSKQKAVNNVELHWKEGMNLSYFNK